MNKMHCPDCGTEMGERKSLNDFLGLGKNGLFSCLIVFIIAIGIMGVVGAVSYAVYASSESRDRRDEMLASLGLKVHTTYGPRGDGMDEIVPIEPKKEE